MVELAAHTESTPDPLWAFAKPASEDLYHVTDNGQFTGSVEVREQLRRAMASAMSCIHDAIQNAGTRMAGPYLAGAERMVQTVLEELCRAFEADCIAEEDYLRLFDESGQLCCQLHERLFSLPASSRDTIMINNYVEMHIPERHGGISKESA